MKIISSFPYSVLLEHSSSQGFHPSVFGTGFPDYVLQGSLLPPLLAFHWRAEKLHLQFRKYPVAELSHMWCVCQKSVSISVTANKRDTDISKKQSLPPEVEVGVAISPSPSHILQADGIHYHTNTPGHVNGEHKQL